MQIGEIDHAMEDTKIDEVALNFLNFPRILLRCDLCRCWKLPSLFSDSIKSGNKQHFRCDCCFQDYKTQYALAVIAVKQSLFTIEELNGNTNRSDVKIDCLILS